MKTIIYKLIFCFILSGFSFLAISETTDFEIKGSRFSITAFSGVTIVYKNGLELFKKTAVDTDDQAAFILDFNFDGYPDFAILRDSGIQRYYDVFIFEKKSDMYVKNDFLSSLPCPHANEKTKLISSTCNHGSACENWENYYKYDKGKFFLVRRNGFTCNPVSGQMFKYEEIYDHGKLKKQITVPFVDNKTTQ